MRRQTTASIWNSSLLNIFQIGSCHGLWNGWRGQADWEGRLDSMLKQNISFFADDSPGDHSECCGLETEASSALSNSDTQVLTWSSWVLSFISVRLSPLPSEKARWRDPAVSFGQNLQDDNTHTLARFCPLRPCRVSRADRAPRRSCKTYRWIWPDSWAVQSYSCWQWVSDIRYDNIHIFFQIHTSYLSDQTVVSCHFVLKTVVHYNNQPICQSYQDCLSVFCLRWNPHCRWCTHCSSQTGLLVFKLQLVQCIYFSELFCMGIPDVSYCWSLSCSSHNKFPPQKTSHVWDYTNIPWIKMLLSRDRTVWSKKWPHQSPHRAQKNHRKRYYMTRCIATMIMTLTLLSGVDRNRKSVIAASGDF